MLAQESAVASAVNKMKAKASSDTGFLRRVFHRFDRDKSGELEEDEFRMALKSMGCRLNPHEFSALMTHFNPNGSGGIDYGELMWGCFNSEQLLKHWRKRTRGKSKADIKLIFFNYLSFGDKLTPRHLQKVMAEVFNAELSGDEVRVLFEKVCSECREVSHIS
jgi:hypothetical protein